MAETSCPSPVLSLRNKQQPLCVPGWEPWRCWTGREAKIFSLCPVSSSPQGCKARPCFNSVHTSSQVHPEGARGGAGLVTAPGAQTCLCIPSVEVCLPCDAAQSLLWAGRGFVPGSAAIWPRSSVPAAVLPTLSWTTFHLEFGCWVLLLALGRRQGARTC